MTDPAPNPAPTPNPAPNPAPNQAPAPNPAPAPQPEPKAGDQAPTPAPEPKPNPDPTAAEFKVPEQYKDKGWAPKVKSLDDVYKQLDELDALKGKKTIIPDLSKATAEEREAFYSQLRGKDATEYPVPDNPVYPTPPETKAVVADLFMKNGVSPTQAAEIIKGYQEFGAQQFAAQFSEEGFKAAMTESFGADKYNQVIGEVRTSMKNYMNETDFKLLDALPNSYAALVYRTLGNTMAAVKKTLQAYGVKETDMAHFAGKGNNAPADMETARQGIRNEITAMSSRMHSDVEMQTLINKLDATYKDDARRSA